MCHHIQHTWCGNKETGLLLSLISGHVDDEEKGRALTCGLPSTFTQSVIHVHRLESQTVNQVYYKNVLTTLRECVR